MLLFPGESHRSGHGRHSHHRGYERRQKADDDLERWVVPGAHAQIDWQQLGLVHDHAGLCCNLAHYLQGKLLGKPTDVHHGRIGRIGLCPLDQYLNVCLPTSLQITFKARRDDDGCLGLTGHQPSLHIGIVARYVAHQHIPRAPQSGNVAARQVCTIPIHHCHGHTLDVHHECVSHHQEQERWRYGHQEEGAPVAHDMARLFADDSPSSEQVHCTTYPLILRITHRPMRPTNSGSPVEPKTLIQPDSKPRAGMI